MNFEVANQSERSGAEVRTLSRARQDPSWLEDCGVYQILSKQRVAFWAMVGELSEPSKRRVKGQGTITLASAILFSITLVAVHIIEPEMNFGPLSLYSVGPYGIVM